MKANGTNVKLQQTFKTPKYQKENCKKTKRFSLRITAHQHEEISQLAKKNGLSINQYLLNRAFEQPQVNFDVGKDIAEMDESINHINRYRMMLGDDIEEWVSRTHCIEGIVGEVKYLNKIFNQFKNDMYKSFLSPVELAKFERQEKRQVERENRKEVKGE